ncbi:MAG: hypothetical protein GY821_17020 [Gammaproteobacteria bacterium]|nr:hypothetical protein [Gammaproteobacteria bacterium]
MAIRGLNHYTIISDNLSANRLFYSQIVGLECLSTERKGVTQFIDFALPSQSTPVVSVIDGTHPYRKTVTSTHRNTGFELHGTVNPQGKSQFATGPFEHICFNYEEVDFDRIKTQLHQHDFACRESFDWLPTCKQIWTLDPNGIKVEFLFECQ